MNAKFVGAAIWAFIAGLSVTPNMIAKLSLNDTDADKAAHGYYVITGMFFFSTIWLSMLALVQGGTPVQKPQRKWSIWGGAVVLPLFASTVPGARVLGYQFVTMLTFVGTVAMALAIDVKVHHLRISLLRLQGLLLLVLATALQLPGALSGLNGSREAVALYACLVPAAAALSAFVGMMNKRLAQDLGSATRACAVASAMSFTLSLPVCLFLRLSGGVPLLFRWSQWWLWMISSLQAAFSTFSLMQLPKFISYSLCFVLLLTGQLTGSLLADTIGFSRHPVPVSIIELTSTCIMLLGAIFYTTQSRSMPESAVDDRPAGSLVETITSIDFEPAPVDCES